MTETIKLTKQQQRVLILVYKFRFVTKPLLARILKIRYDSTYELIESLVKLGLLEKVYKDTWRIDRKPAYYYLNPKGVTAVRKLLDVKEKVVNPLYKDANAKKEFIDQCLATLTCYIPIKHQYPDANILTKTEINRFKMFPDIKPDLYIKTTDGQEAFVVILPDSLPYFVNKVRDKYIEHSEDIGWRDGGKYPTIAFVVHDNSRKAGFLFNTQKKLDDIGMVEGELNVLATGIEALLSGNPKVWGDGFNPLKPVSLL